MKAIALLFMCTWVFNVAAFNAATTASVAIVNEAIELCKEYALEDDVKNEELESYLLKCVNEDLESRGFQKIESLD